MRWFGGICLLALASSARSFVLPDDEKVKGDTGEDGDGALNWMLMAPKQAKSFLRVRRWNIKSAWGEEQDEEHESRERRTEATNLQNKINSCRSSCWLAWSGWGPCSDECGTEARQYATRAVKWPPGCPSQAINAGCPGEPKKSQKCPGTCHGHGTMNARGCTCSAGFSGLCCKTAITCGYPGKPSNGAVSVTGSVHAYNTVATYSCNKGYALQGSSSRKCTGSWSGAVPTCNIIHCPTPGVPANGKKVGDKTEYGSTVVYSCNEGYLVHPAGSASITCKENKQWSAPVPECQAVTCPQPTKPANGWVKSSSLQFGNKAEFGCSAGFHLTGSTTRTCLPSGQWDGAQPSCNAITCPVLTAPTHGTVTMTSQKGDVVSHGGKATFKCSTGYTLSGPAERTCGGNGPAGAWSGDQPTCQPVSCGAPAVPSHGTRIGNTFTYTGSVSFQCLPGYFLKGNKKITCGSNKAWSGPPPTCQACAKNTYKSASNDATQCTSCPAHTHTIAAASTELKQCLCDSGFKGPAGGPCQEIICPALTAPQHGQIGTCPKKVNTACAFTCSNGYIRSKGDAQRKCLGDGTWSGVAPICSACPKDTYKSEETVCKQCPENSETSGQANEKTGCKCKAGYQGPAGGSCKDVDECKTNKGGCEQTCENTVGSYKCKCTQAGYLTDADDPKKCVSKNLCPSLAPPDNGGVVCVAERKTSTERCEVKCNPGYEHLVRVNEFEECGPSTNWLWTSEAEGVGLLPCVEQFFTGVELEAEVVYFADQCDQLSAAQKDSLRKQFIEMLNFKGICVENNRNVCDINDIEIDCGASGSRRRRNAKQELRIKFKVKIDKVAKNDVNCSEYCANEKVPTEQCKSTCWENHEKQNLDTLKSTSAHVKELFSRESNGQPKPTGYVEPVENIEDEWKKNIPVLSIGDKILLPSSEASISSVQTFCEDGMVLSDKLCVPCPAGSFFTPDKTCVLCPKYTYQPEPQQKHCLHCPISGGAPKRGSTSCVMPTTITSSTTTATPRKFTVNLGSK